MAYETWGRLNATADNAVVICHALTGDAHAAGVYAGDDRPGWWDPLIGPGRALDTDRYFVVCANIRAAAGAPPARPARRRATGSPTAAASRRSRCATSCGCNTGCCARSACSGMAAVIGGSLGGMQVLEWAVLYPGLVRNAITIGASLAHSAQGIAYNLIGREAIMLDPAWQGGDYYGTGAQPGARPGPGAHDGHHHLPERRVDAPQVRPDARGGRPAESYYRPASRFQVENYLHYQGGQPGATLRRQQLPGVEPGHGPARPGPGARRLAAALGADRAADARAGCGHQFRYSVPHRLAAGHRRRAAGAGRQASYAEIESPWGHDAFLIEYGQLGAIVAEFLRGSHDAN